MSALSPTFAPARAVETSNLQRMTAAVERWIAEAKDENDPADLDRRAAFVEGSLADLSDASARNIDPAPSLIGLTAWDLSDAVSTLRAAATLLRNRKAPDGWVVIDAEFENRHRDTVIVVTPADGEEFTTTLQAFLSDNDGLEYEDRMGGALHRGETYRGGGGAAPEWSFRKADDMGSAAFRSAGAVS